MNIWFQIIESIAPLIPVFASFILKPAKQKWITVLVIYGLIYFPVVSYANYLQSEIIPNIGFYVFITVLTFCVFSLIISFLINNKIFTLISYVLMGLVTLYAIANAIWWEKLALYNSNTSSISSFILIVYCLYYYWLQIKKPKNVFISREPSFWLIAGVFIYSGGNFFLFTYYHEICVQALQTKDVDKRSELWQFVEVIWIINDFLILIANIFFAKAILCSRRI